VEDAYDLVVVGAGPAGTTLASLIKRHRPSARVLIVEKAAFPRHHVGESLLPGMVHVLREIGAYDLIKNAGFPRKFGATFLWGRGREPWDADFVTFGREVLEKYGDVLTDESSWQVVRAQYDSLLLEHARALGAEVLMPASAVEPIEKDGRIEGLVLETGGKKRRVSARLVADASGQAGFLSRFRKVRRCREDLRHVAAYAYYRGARWKHEYVGYPDKTKIFVCSVPEGWFWFIPISRDVVSVGLVSKAARAKERGGEDYRAFFERALRSCAELWPQLEGAEVLKGMDPAEPDKDFFTISDWSFESEAASGPGWAAVGDAAFFIDPLLSSGVTLAHLSAHRAAYALLTAWEEDDAALADALWKDYDRYCREISGSFLDLVRHWYGGHENPEQWWENARGVLRSAAPLELGARSSFIGVITGAYAHYERAYADPGWLFASNRRALSAWGTAADAGPGAPLPDSALPRWRVPPEFGEAFVPVSGAGRLRPIARVGFPAGTGDPLDDFARPKRRLLPGPHLAIVRSVDGRADVAQIKLRLRAELALPADAIDAQVERLLRDLASLGVLELSDGPGAAAAEPALGLERLRDGEARLRRGDAAGAERALSAAIAAGEGGRWALALRGEARRRLGRAPEALADLDAALAPEVRAKGADRAAVLRAEFDALIARGWIEDRARASRAALKLDAGDAAGARAEADAALRLNPGQSDALKVRAQALRALGDLEGARRDLEAVRGMLGGGKTP
jgi:flavin-dependent dehydrogenase